MRPFEAAPNGGILTSFSVLETELLSDLATEVCELLDIEKGLPRDRLLATVGIGGETGPSDDPAIARLLPSAYPDDEEAAREFRHLTEHSLRERKIANARSMRRSLEAGGETELGADEQQAWLRTLTDIRLIIASRLGIEDDGDRGDDNAGTEADLMMQDVYDWVGMVQAALIEALP